MRYRLLAFSLLMFIFGTSVGFGYEETCVDVKSEILTGLGIQDYYSGDHFWYNITLTNSGTTTINATFTVTVRDPKGEILKETVTYRRYLEPNMTTTLFPNYTRLGKDEVFIYFMDVVGTYTIELTSDVRMEFYRYYTTGRYTVEHDKCHISIDAMPSYQKEQNDKWDQYFQENARYIDTVQSYIYESRLETEKTQALALGSMLVAMVSVLTGVTFIPEEIRRRERWSMILLRLIIVILVLYVSFVITLSVQVVIIMIVVVSLPTLILYLYRNVIEPRIRANEEEPIDYVV